jgi:hypothetical protein
VSAGRAWLFALPFLLTGLITGLSCARAYLAARYAHLAVREARASADACYVAAERLLHLAAILAGDFWCPRCHMVSHNPNDLLNGWCGNCCDQTAPAQPAPQ